MFNPIRSQSLKMDSGVTSNSCHALPRSAKYSPDRFEWLFSGRGPRLRQIRADSFVIGTMHSVKATGSRPAVQGFRPRTRATIDTAFTSYINQFYEKRQGRRLKRLIFATSFFDIKRLRTKRKERRIVN